MIKPLAISRVAWSSWKIEQLLAQSNELEWHHKFRRARFLAWWVKIRMAIHQLRYRSPAI